MGGEFYTIGLGSMRQAKMLVMSLGSMKSIWFVIAMGGSNATPGILNVKKSAFRAGTRLEHQNLVIMPKITDTKEVAASKQGQSSMGDGNWLTRRRQTCVTVRAATKILYKCTIHARNGNDDAPLERPRVIYLSTVPVAFKLRVCGSGRISSCNFVIV